MILLVLCAISLWAPSVDAAKIALLNIDVQNCFVTGGTLPVPQGETVVPIINDIIEGQQDKFEVIVNTQDWHPHNHVSFASQHPGHGVYDTINLGYSSQGRLCTSSNVNTSYSSNCSEVAHNVTQTLWPDHCVINTTDADFVSTLLITSKTVLVRKGYKREIDSYSAFYDNGGFTQTELHTRLKDYKIDTLFITGLATDFCLYWTAKDAKKLGYKVYVVLDASKGITEEGSNKAVADMKSRGIHMINSTDVTSTLKVLTQTSSATVVSSNYILLAVIVAALWTSLYDIAFI